MNVAKITPDLIVYVTNADSEDDMAEGNEMQPVGTVDHMDGDRYIKLAKNDSPDGKHRWISTDFVEDIDEDAVYLKCTYDEFMNSVLFNPPQTGERQDRSVA